MRPDQQNRCTVQIRGVGSPHLAFDPSGTVSCYSNALFTVDLRPDVSVEAARTLAEQINAQVWSISTTVF